MSKLLIVESPSKVPKMWSFLGEGWRVEASLGHVRDLPQNDLGIALSDGFKPVYEILKGKESQVRRLMKAIREADAIYLATDPDREGEAIAWHILELAHVPKKKPGHRVTFTAITKAGVLAAIATPRQLDDNLVEAQQARRLVDRVVGYMASALVCRALSGRYSAGRVQSVCLRLVGEREAEIKAFVAQQYWTLDVRLNTVGGGFTARLTNVKGKKVEHLSAEQVEQIVRGLDGGVFWVGAVEQGEQNRRPAPSFTTSSLQQAASKALGLSPDKTMELAQVLYEAGLITYMRTDGVSIAPEAQQAARQFIAATYGGAYVPEKPQQFEARMDNAQEAHEGIRTVDVARTAESIGGASDGIGARLYHLIWQRFVASQMADARYAQSSATICVGKTPGKPLPAEFAARGRRLLLVGFLKVSQEALDDGEQPDDDEALSPLTVNQSLH